MAATLPPPDYGSMLKRDLEILAAGREVEVASGDTKTDIVEKLVAQDIEARERDLEDYEGKAEPSDPFREGDAETFVPPEETDNGAGGAGEGGDSN